MRTFQNKLAMITITMIVIICHVNVSAQYGSTVREDRIWNYLHSYYGVYPGTVESGYHFEGTEIVNDVVYAVFRDGDNNKLALMRQEDEKVYIYLEEENNCVLYPGRKDEAPAVGEFLLYDFAQKNAEYKALGFSSVDKRNTYEVDFKIADTIDVTNCEYIYTSQSLDYSYIYQDEVWYEGNTTVIEGLGNTSGLLPFPQFISDIIHWVNVYHLYTVEDKEGNIIYSSGKSPDVAAEKIASEQREQEMYDLFGRKVHNPIKGGIYIQNGKKILVK